MVARSFRSSTAEGTAGWLNNETRAVLRVSSFGWFDHCEAHPADSEANLLGVPNFEEKH
jgi:hypothetical protein